MSEDGVPSREMHPSVVGRADEMTALADAVRRLIAATMLNRAPAADVERVARDVDEVARQLEQHVPDPPPPVTNMQGGGVVADDGSFADHMAFDFVVGRFNPMALPIVVSFEPERVVGRGQFTLPYEGPPGCVHGAVIAASFDIVLTAANILAGAAGPTVSLTTRYRRPTLLHVESVLEAWVERVEGARVHTRGRLLQGEKVTVECEGVFAVLDRERTISLAREGH